MKSILTFALAMCLSSAAMAESLTSAAGAKTPENPSAPYVELAPRIAPQPLAGVTIVYDSITDLRFPPFPGTVRCYTDGGQGQSVGGKHLGEWWRGGWHGPKQVVEERFLRQRLRLLPPRSMWLIDIEHWPYDLRRATDAQVEESVRKMRRVLAIARDERPDLIIGSYASIPGDYWSVVQYSMALDLKTKADRGEIIDSKDQWMLGNFEKFQAEFHAWQKACDRMQFGVRDDGSIDRNGGFIDAMDVMTPTCYLVADADDGMDDPKDIISDRHHLSGIMKEAQRVGGGRPIIPFMMNTLLESSVPADRLLIRPGRLRAALETLRDNGASGVIMWGWTKGQPLDREQTEAMQIAQEVFGKYTPGKPSEKR